MFAETMFAACRNGKHGKFAKSNPIPRTWEKEYFRIKKMQTERHRRPGIKVEKELYKFTRIKIFSFWQLIS